MDTQNYHGNISQNQSFENPKKQAEQPFIAMSSNPLCSA